MVHLSWVAQVLLIKQVPGDVPSIDDMTQEEVWSPGSHSAL